MNFHDPATIFILIVALCFVLVVRFQQLSREEQAPGIRRDGGTGIGDDRLTGGHQITLDEMGSGDLLRLIGELCDAARTYTSERSFGWARDCLLNAKLAAEAYAILVPPDNSAEPRGE